MKRVENMKYWRKKNLKILFFSIFKKFIKNSNNIPSISKSIQHTPMTWCTYLQSFEKIHQCVFELQCENYTWRTDRRTDGWGTLQYLPSRAFGAAGDKNRNHFDTVLFDSLNNRFNTHYITQPSPTSLFYLWTPPPQWCHDYSVKPSSIWLLAITGYY